MTPNAYNQIFHLSNEKLYTLLQYIAMLVKDSSITEGTKNKCSSQHRAGSKYSMIILHPVTELCNKNVL